MPHLFLLRELIIYYVYVIVEKQTGGRYVGFTADLKKRLSDHNRQRGALYTKTGQWFLAYYEAFLSRKDDITRENKLKQDGRSRYQLFRRIDESLAGQK